MKELSPRVARLLPLLVVVLLLQSLYNSHLPLSGDEAYYWVWSHHLQAGYHDHPPAIAVLMAMTTRLGGDSVMMVRLAGALCIALTVMLQVRLAAKVAGDAAGWVAFLLCLLLPAFQMGFTLATPDDPLVLFWTAGLFCAVEALTGSRHWVAFVTMGAFCGLAMDSKYTGVLLPLAITVFIAWREPRLLLSARLWTAGGVALAVFSPVLWWNATHDFESFLFQYRHGSAESVGFNGGAFLQFLGGQALVLSPVLLAVLVFLLVRRRGWWSDPVRALLVVCCLAPLALFLEKALFAKIQLNWALPAYLSVLPLLAGFLAERRRRSLWLAAALLPALILTVAVKWPLSVGLTGKYNPQNRLFGPEAAAREIEALRAPEDVILADHLQRASLLTFLLAGHPRTYIPTPSRFSEYTRWDRDVDFTKLHGLYLSTDDRMTDLGKVFSSVTLVERLRNFRPGGREQNYYIYRVGP